MTRDQITELLKNYRSYKYAVRNYEMNHLPAASIANYDFMPRSPGFESSAPRNNTGITFQDELDYRRYKRVVDAIDGAVNEVLSDNERVVIKCKWMNPNRINLNDIAQQKGVHPVTVKRWHRDALKALSIALSFVGEVPYIHEIKEKALV